VYNQFDVRLSDFALFDYEFLPTNNEGDMTNGVVTPVFERKIPGQLAAVLTSRITVQLGDEDTVIAQWGANHPLGRVGTPQEVADAILFLASPLSGFVTGTELRVDGGLLAAVAVAAPETS